VSLATWSQMQSHLPALFSLLNFSVLSKWAYLSAPAGENRRSAASDHDSARVRLKMQPMRLVAAITGPITTDNDPLLSRLAIFFFTRSQSRRHFALRSTL